MNREESFKQYLRLKGMSPLSIRAYVYYFRKFKGLQDFNQAYINKFVLWNGNSAPVRAFISNLKAWILAEKDLLQLSKMEEEDVRNAELIKKTGARKRDLPEVLTEIEVKKLINAFEDYRSALMCCYNFYLGLRVHELTEMKLTDFQVDWKEIKEMYLNKVKMPVAEIRITGKRQKTRIEFVHSWLLEKTYDFFKGRELLLDRGMWLIGDRRWQIILKKHSINTLGKAITPHTLRHSCATWLYVTHNWNLKEIADYLGHESISTTEKYTHIHKRELKEKNIKIFEGF